MSVKIRPAYLRHVDLGPQPTELHNEPCKACSDHSACLDPEEEQVRDWIEAGDDWHDHAFRCAWRPEKLCYSFSRYAHPQEPL